jgi:N-acyl-D-amino-acid deacylase
MRMAVMGEDASVRKQPTDAEMTEMRRLVAQSNKRGRDGLGGSYPANHIPTPSTYSGWGGRQSATSR